MLKGGGKLDGIFTNKTMLDRSLWFYQDARITYIAQSNKFVTNYKNKRQNFEID